MPKISELSSMPNPAVYRRSTGETYAKLNEAFHVKAVISGDGVKGAGIAERLDPNEDVSVLSAA